MTGSHSEPGSTRAAPARKENDMPSHDTTAKTWLITGAGRGIGVAFAHAVA
jgi:hypothetical protein